MLLRKRKRKSFLMWQKILQIKLQLAVLTHTVQMLWSNQLSSFENVYYFAFIFKLGIFPYKKIETKPLLLDHFFL